MQQIDHYVEKISKNKLYKLGFRQYTSYWHINKNQTHMLNIIKQTLTEYADWVYTRKKDNTGLFYIVIWVKKDENIRLY